MLIPQSYPTPTELPAMRAGETDGRYLDCTPALAPVGDTFTGLNTLSLTISRWDGVLVTSDDLQRAGTAWEDSLDSTDRIPAFGFIAPLAAAGVTYVLTLTASPTFQGRVFVRDWMMSVVPLLG